MFVTELRGNPLTIQSELVHMELHEIKQKCLLLESEGLTVEEEKDEMVEKDFGSSMSGAPRA